MTQCILLFIGIYFRETLKIFLFRLAKDHSSRNWCQRNITWKDAHGIFLWV